LAPQRAQAAPFGESFFDKNLSENVLFLEPFREGLSVGNSGLVGNQKGWAALASATPVERRMNIYPDKRIFRI
jgi:hypothetical protein